MDQEAIELFDQNGAMIRAAEDWSEEYKKDDKTFGKLLKAEAKMERTFYSYLKGLADRAPEFVDWDAYEERLKQVQAADSFNITTLISDTEINQEDSIVMKVMFDPVETLARIGIEAGQKIYNRQLGDSEVSKAVEKTAREQIAQLVGKRVDKSGNIVDNPRAEYRISDTTRTYIRESVRTSLSLGEDQEEATARLKVKLKDADRAAKVASTESVNAYQGGIYNFAQESGAVGKEWQSISGACVICDGNVDDGIIPIDALFSSGDASPAAHPYDRCGVRYVYQEELDALKP